MLILKRHATGQVFVGKERLKMLGKMFVPTELR
jgi:hypothetical protein